MLCCIVSITQLTTCADKCVEKRAGGSNTMIFVKSEDLKYGMRLAKPIYNKTGVLLYERNTRLTLQGIESVKNFGLLGLYILEPAEPVPPMSEEDLDFEQVTEICIRVGKPVCVYLGGKEVRVNYTAGREELKEIVNYMSRYSPYAFEEEMRKGFLTIEGGHRVGMAG